MESLICQDPHHNQRLNLTHRPEFQEVIANKTARSMDFTTRNALRHAGDHRISRRKLLGAAGSGSILCTISRAFAEEDANPQPSVNKAKNVILLWLEGGPSQWETFDPHPNSRYSGEASAIRTRVPDLMISELLPQTAEIMHHATLIRSLTSKEGDHERAVYNIKSGFRPDPTLIHPSIGAVICHENEEAAELPRHISIVPQNSPGVGGFLGAKYDAFKINDPAQPVPDIEKRVSQERNSQRIDDLYSIVETEFQRGRLRKLEMERTLHKTATDAALKMMSSEQLDAFDISRESLSLRNSFGDSSFGRGCLAAVRLIESGTRCVEVTLGGWDSHITNHTLQAAGCKTLDPALASLINLLEERDLLDSTLVICGGEFGRTPRINPAEGRDHWPHGFSMFLAGCGIGKGRVYGATDPEPNPNAPNTLAHVENPVTISDLHATIYTALGISPHLEYQTPIGRPIKRSEGQPIKQILA